MTEVSAELGLKMPPYQSFDAERAAAEVARTHTEARPLPGRDLSGVIAGRASAGSIDGAIYFMTEDNVTSGQAQSNVLTGEPFPSLEPPACIESVVANLPTGANGKLLRRDLRARYEASPR